MNNNLETLIRAIVPLSFMAIWALTSLFNREAKPSPSTTRPNPNAPPRPRPAGDPTLRFASRAAGPVAPAARRAPDRRDDEIIILSSSTMPVDRARPGRPAGGSPRRPARGKPTLPERKPEPPAPSPTRTRLAGVTQTVNQQLANATIDLAPLTALPPVTSLPPLGLAGATAATAAMPGAAAPRESAAASLRDPARLREAFVLNEVLQPPVSLRPRPGHRTR